MDSAKLKENLFAVANRARGGRKCGAASYSRRTEPPGLARVPRGAGTGTPLCCHHPAHPQRGPAEAGAGWGDSGGLG